MGGYNSGRWHHHRAKTTTADCLSFDINKVPINRFMEAERVQTREYYWTRGRDSKRVGNMGISYQPKQSRIVFSYQIVTDTSRQSFDEIIQVTRKPLPYGGFQYFIHCPQCQSRRRALHKPPDGSRFLCRDCYKLTYVSSQEAHKDDRGELRNFKISLDMVVRFEKIRDKLKGKHYGSKAYNRLMRKMQIIYAKLQAVKNLPLYPPAKITINGKRAFIKK